ncbi:MAG TPA: hypothetical protein VHE79_08110, partial [Spirochaetia bacterium]
MLNERRKPELREAYYRQRLDAPATPAIDDRTWSDMDMDAVFLKLDRTCSSVGEAVLYDAMRRPLFDPDEIAERAARIRALTEDARLRLRKILGRLGAQRDAEVFTFLLTQGRSIEDRLRFVYVGLGILAILAIPAAIAIGVKGLLVLGAVVVVNFVIHYRFKAIVTTESSTYEYLHRLFVAARRIARSGVRVEGITEELGELSAGFTRLRRRTALLLSPSGMAGDIAAALMDFVRQFTLQEVIAYFMVHNELIRRRAELHRLYTLVGTLDALQSIATLRAELPGLCTPRVVDGLRFEADDIVHPLLETPVANTVRMDGRGVIVTGSNMSGKSTFLRTIGINQVLATTVCVAFARRMESGALLTMSSITNRDSVLTSESHYLVEAKRLLEIRGAASGPYPVLV